MKRAGNKKKVFTPRCVSPLVVLRPKFQISYWKVASRRATANIDCYPKMGIFFKGLLSLRQEYNVFLDFLKSQKQFSHFGGLKKCNINFKSSNLSFWQFFFKDICKCSEKNWILRSLWFLLNLNFVERTPPNLPIFWNLT